MNISDDDIKDFMDAASASVIKNDRQLYDPYFVVFEEFAISRGLTFTLLSAARFIIARGASDPQPSHDSYFLTVASPSPENDARVVANMILDVKSVANLPKRVILKKDSVGWTIVINGRVCFVISPEMKYRGKGVDEIIGHETGRGLWTHKDVRCQNIYGVCAYLLSQLYDPLRFVPPDVSRELLRGLLPMISQPSKSGGREKHKKHSSPPKQTVKDVFESHAKNIYIVGNKKGSLPIYLYDGDFDAFCQIMTKKMSIRIAAYSLHDYDDFSLTKYTFHDADERPICIFYNSMDHQMIPIAIRAGDSYGSTCKIYTLRSIILEIQMLKLMSHLGKDMRPMISRMQEDVGALQDIIADGAEEIVGYAGAAINWNILRRESGGFFGVFYPTDNGHFGETRKVRGGDENDEDKYMTIW